MVLAAQVFGQLMSTVATGQSNGTLPAELRYKVTAVALHEIGVDVQPQDIAQMVEAEKAMVQKEKEANRVKFLNNIMQNKNGNGHAEDVDELEDDEMEKPSYAEMVRMGINPFGEN